MEHWEFYKDHAGKWRWRRTASNEEIIGASTQGYTRKFSAIKNAIKNGYVKTS